MATAVAAAVMATAAVGLAAVTLQALEALAVASNALVEVDNGVTVLAEDGSLALASLVLAEATGDMDHEGMVTNDILDADGRNLDGAEELLRSHILDGNLVVGLGNDGMALLIEGGNKVGVLAALVLEGVDELSTVDDEGSLDVLAIKVVGNAAELLAESLADDHGDLSLATAASEDLNIGLGAGAGAGGARTRLARGGRRGAGLGVVSKTVAAGAGRTRGGRAASGAGAGSSGASSGGGRAAGAVAIH